MWGLTNAIPNYVRLLLKTTKDNIGCFFEKSRYPVHKIGFWRIGQNLVAKLQKIRPVQIIEL